MSLSSGILSPALRAGFDAEDFLRARNTLEFPNTQKFHLERAFDFRQRALRDENLILLGVVTNAVQFFVPRLIRLMSVKAAAREFTYKEY